MNLTKKDIEELINAQKVCIDMVKYYIFYDNDEQTQERLNRAKILIKKLRIIKKGLVSEGRSPTDLKSD